MLAPRANRERQPEYVVLRAAENQEIWPVGWPLKKPRRNVLPGMFELVNVELEDIPLSQLLEVLGERLKVPMLIDQAARHGRNSSAKSACRAFQEIDVSIVLIRHWPTAVEILLRV